MDKSYLVFYKRIVFVLIFFFPLWTSSLSNSEQAKIDTLMMQLPQIEEDSMRVDAYNALAFHYGAINLDSSSHYLLKAKRMAIATNYTKGLALNYSYFARVAIEKTEFDEAIENFDSAVCLFSLLEDSAQLLDCYLGLGYVYNYESKKLHTLECNQKALPLALALRDSAKLAVIYNNIGSFYYRLGDFENTYTYFRKSLDMEEAIMKDSTEVVLSYSNLAMLLVKNKKYEEAKPLCNNIKHLLPQINSTYVSSILHLSLVSYYNAIENLELSGIHLVRVRSILEDANHHLLNVRLYKRYAEWHLLKKDYLKCIEYSNMNIETQNTYNIKEELDDVYALLAKAYYLSEDYENAYRAMLLFKEELQSSENKKITYLLAEFEEQRLAQELEERRLSEVINNQKLETITAQLRFKYYIAIFFIVILLYTVIVATYNWHKSRNRSRVLSDKNELINQQKEQLKSQLYIIQENEEKLKQAVATKDKFISIIAHDLRSPFSSMIGFSELIVQKLENNSTEKVLDYAKLIHEVANNSYSLLNNLLEWAMEKVGKMSFTLEHTYVNTFLNDMVGYFNQLLPERTIHVETAMPDDFTMNVDRKMMQSVFRNLISNALKYTPSTGVITLTAAMTSDRIRFVVSDTGIGLSEAQQAKLFRIEEAESTPGLNKEKGTGLGLILCKDFVEKHQGIIGVESQEGQGASFYFELPLL